MRRRLKVPVGGIGVVPAMLLLGGCLASAPFVPPQPGDRAGLASRVEADATDVDAVTALAVLDLLDGRPEDALATLVEGGRRVAGDPLLPVLTAYAAERANAPGEAFALYAAYASSHAGALASWASMRREAVQPDAVRRAVREGGTMPVVWAGARERVAILPFAHGGNAADHTASVAIAALLVDDLRQLNQWDVVDARAVRVLLEEWAVDPSTHGAEALAVRVGSALRVSRVVQLTATPESGSFNRWSVRVTTLQGGAITEVAQPEPMIFAASPDELLLVERRTSAMIVDALRGRDASDRVSSEHAASREALESYGRGLLALDVDDPGAARSELAVAMGLDPSFDEARDLHGETFTWLDWSLTPPADALLGIVRMGERQRAVLSQWGGPGSVPSQSALAVGTRDRSILVDALGLDVGSSVAVELIFQIPGGSVP